jgi:hypothetical protein
MELRMKAEEWTVRLTHHPGEKPGFAALGALEFKRILIEKNISADVIIAGAETSSEFL